MYQILKLFYEPEEILHKHRKARKRAPMMRSIKVSGLKQYLGGSGL